MPVARPRRFVPILVAVAWLTSPAFAQELPECRGADLAAAGRAFEEGRRHYRRAMAMRQPQAELRLALASFEAQCAAGDDSAHEWRGYALAGLERFLEAARSFDAFLASHPLATLPADARLRVDTAQRQVLDQVASVQVECALPDARVTIDGAEVGTAPGPFRARPGPVRVGLLLPQRTPQERSLEAAAGQTLTVSFACEPPAAAVSVTPVARDATGHDRGSRRGLLGAAIATTVVAAAVFGVGLGSTVWRTDLTHTIARDCVTLGPGCAEIFDRYDTASALQWVGLLGGGVIAAGAGLIYYFALRPAPAARVAWGPMLTGWGVTWSGVL